MAEILLGNIKGPKGVTFTPSVDSSGNLSWSNDGDLVNPPTVNIKGPKGDQGPAGEGGGGSGDAIPKTGNRGVLAGYEQIVFEYAAVQNGLIVTPDTPDVSLGMVVMFADPDESWVVVSEGEESATYGSMVKLVYVMADSFVVLGDRWAWQNEEVPTFGAYGVLVAQFFPSMMGVVSYVPLI